MITIVTITGADESVKPGDLFKLSMQYPFVEWAILVSPKATGKRARFPKMDWIKSLCDVAAVTKHSQAPMKLALHLCGDYVNEFLVGNHTNIAKDLGDVWDSFKRVQINTHGELHETNLLPMEIGICFFPDKEFIFQNDGQHNHVLEYLKTQKVDNFSTLFDMSHGTGVMPEKWPALLPGLKCGYAGGISPENIIHNCLGINKIVGEVETWIDMETHVRSHSDKQFDLYKVEDCLKQASQFKTRKLI